MRMRHLIHCDTALRGAITLVLVMQVMCYCSSHLCASDALSHEGSHTKALAVLKAAGALIEISEGVPGDECVSVYLSDELGWRNNADLGWLKFIQGLTRAIAPH